MLYLWHIYEYMLVLLLYLDQTESKKIHSELLKQFSSDRTILIGPKPILTSIVFWRLIFYEHSTIGSGSFRVFDVIMWVTSFYVVAFGAQSSPVLENDVSQKPYHNQTQRGAIHRDDVTICDVIITVVRRFCVVVRRPETSAGIYTCK